MNSDLISVIIPVYNVEKYLSKCVNSIINQTYKKLEIILVDDGSLDTSGTICDEFWRKDERILVIHQENKGGGYARNVGLEKAKGKYISFIDSDDYIAPNMYEQLIDIFEKENADIVECEFVEVNDSEYLFSKANEGMCLKQFSTKQALKENISDHYFRQLIWNKLYRKDIIGNIRFPVNTKIDDEFFTYKVIGNARKLVHCDEKMYAYRQHANSVMHSIDVKKRMEGIAAKCERHEYLIEHFPEIEPESCYQLWVSCIFQGQISLKLLDKKQRIEVFSFLNKVISKYPIMDLRSRHIPLKQRVWIELAKLSLEFVCLVRNILKIGI